MDKVIDGQFARVETALGALISSIATYNPSPHLAQDLLDADAELSSGLAQLSIHQQNHQRLQALRSASAALDAQIRDTLTSLTLARAELRALPSSADTSISGPSADTAQVGLNDLLRYASRIAKFTRPLTFREPESADAVSGGATASPKAQNEKLPHGFGTQTNDASTPAASFGINGEKDGGVKTNASRAQSETSPVAVAEGAGTDGANAHPTTLPEAYAKWLDPASDMPFVPWPTDETIRRGALASIQILVDQGIDPTTFDPEQSAALEAERRRREEEEELQRAREEEERQREMERRRSIAASGGGLVKQEEKPKAFNVDLLEDSDED